MTRSFQSIVAAALICIGGSICLGQQVDNPQYKNWAKFKVGTAVTMKTESEMAGNKTSMETTQTLVELTPEKAVVESKMKMANMPAGVDMPGTKIDIPAKIASATTTPPAGTPKPDIKESSEDVTIAGKTYKAKVIESKSSANGMDTVSKSWTSEDVPGMMLKVETTMSGAMAGTTKMSVSEITIK